MNRSLFIAWKSEDIMGGKWGPIGILDYQESGYRFVYTKGARMLNGFHPFPEMPDFNEVYESELLLPFFANRLMTPSRPEYKTYLEWGGFDPKNPPDPLVILSVTEGRRATDSFEIFSCPSPDADGFYINKFFLHGVRWMPQAALERIDALQSGESLGLMLDISNQYDKNAVAVSTCDVENRFMIGYVPRYLARDVRHICQHSDPDFIAVTVDRVNPDAPFQQRLLCRMRALWNNGFRPCSGEEFAPIVESVTPAVR